jgi:hypothetical protein
LRIPLDRGILHVQCPNCSYQFSFDPSKDVIHQSNSRTTSSPFQIISSYRLSKEKIISALLFSILGIYIFRGCQIEESTPIEEPTPPSIHTPIPEPTKPPEFIL